MKFKFYQNVVTYNYSDAEEIINNTNILLVTVNEAEKEAVLKYLLPVPSEGAVVNVIHKKASYFIGRLGCFLVAHVISEMGTGQSGGSLLTVANGIDSIRPQIVIMVGVAFGINKRKQNIGDVLVSRKIQNYEVARVSEDKLEPRGDPLRSGKLLYNVFAKVLDWHYFPARRREAEIFGGEILSGEKLIDNEEYCIELRKNFPKAIGGEMEGAGLSAACDDREISEWILVKGICDWADGNKDKKSQPKAAGSAMSLVFHVLNIKELFEELDLDAFSRKIVDSENEKCMINASKGSPLWVLNRLRSNLLPMIVNDLENKSEKGYNTQLGSAIIRDLKGFRNEIRNLPRSCYGSNKLNGSFNGFINSFENWLSVEGDTSDAKRDRTKIRLEIKDKRDDISEAIRYGQTSINYNIETLNTERMISIQEELASVYSDTLPHYKRAVSRIRKAVKDKNNSTRDTF